MDFFDTFNFIHAIDRWNQYLFYIIRSLQHDFMNAVLLILKNPNTLQKIGIFHRVSQQNLPAQTVYHEPVNLVETPCNRFWITL